MKKAVFTIILQILVMVAYADNSMDAESSRRIHHLCELYNNDLNDSLLHQGPIDLEYHKSQECWENYYETWVHIVNTYVFMGKVNMGLQEVKRMHQDATERKNKYGMALAYYAMGNVYINMGNPDEAVKCYEQSLANIKETNAKATTRNDIYSYYCDALNEQKKYEEMARITDEWKVFLDKIAAEERNKSGKHLNSGVWYSYYYLACAQQHLGTGKLDEADQDINKAEFHHTDKSEFIPMSVLYYRAQLWMKRGEYAHARAYNSIRLDMSKNYDDKSSLVLIYKQRAEIMEALGDYREAAKMYKNVFELTDSIYKKDARTQINELNTMFHVSEIEMEKRLQHTRAITVIAIIIAAALAVLLGYWYWTSRRLRKKNEELAIAHAQAEESLVMKSNFIKNISHEIRTPLNILSGFAQVLAQSDMELPAEVRQEASTNIQENTNRITSLINRLLALSEVTSRTLIERTDTIGINQLCQTAIVNSGVADDQQHQFHFNTHIDDAQTIVTSAQYAAQAIGHLLDNAMKFTPEGGTIRLSCQQKSNVLHISIEDTGCGVPTEKANAIFDEFVQLDEFKDGVGIGLPLSRNIVRQLGGDITLDTTYTDGARFVITLPC